MIEVGPVQNSEINLQEERPVVVSCRQTGGCAWQLARWVL